MKAIKTILRPCLFYNFNKNTQILINYVLIKLKK